MKTHEINGKTYFEPEMKIKDLTTEYEMQYKCEHTKRISCHRIKTCDDCLFDYDNLETVEAYKLIYKKD